MTETLLIALTLVVMIFTLFISLIPYIPGPAIMWAIGVIFAAVNHFERVPILVALLMTGCMIVGSTSEWWLRYLGMTQRGGSCWGVLGSLFGGLLGTLFIPIPILGTLIGAILGALVVEFIRVREAEQAFQAGRSVLEMYLLNIVVEFIMSSTILAMFIISLWWTA